MAASDFVEFAPLREEDGEHFLIWMDHRYYIGAEDVAAWEALGDKEQRAVIGVCNLHEDVGIARRAGADKTPGLFEARGWFTALYKDFQEEPRKIAGNIVYRIGRINRPA